MVETLNFGSGNDNFDMKTDFMNILYNDMKRHHNFTIINTRNTHVANIPYFMNLCNNF